MNDVVAKISLYHNLFQISLVLSVIFLVIAITVFFMLDIRATLGYLTGRRAKKQIKELEEANASSGRLISKSKSMQYVAQEMKNDMGVRQAATPGIRKVDHAVEPAMSQAVLQEVNRGKVLPAPEINPAEVIKTQQNEVYGQDTEVLAENRTYPSGGEISTAILEEKEPVMGRFLITRELILIHTEEVI